MKTLIRLKNENRFELISSGLILKLGEKDIEIGLKDRVSEEILIQLNDGLYKNQINKYINMLDYNTAEQMRNLLFSINQNCCFEYCFFAKNDKKDCKLTIQPEVLQNNLKSSNIDCNAYKKLLVKKYQLSKFSYLCFSNKKFLLKNPLANLNIILDKSLIEYIMLFSNPCSIEQKFLYSEPILRILFSVLVSNKFLIPADETLDPPYQLWSLGDLAFHVHSRMPEAPYPQNFGASFPYVKEKKFDLAIESLESIQLKAPKSRIARNNLSSLDEILQRRKSRRGHGKPEISLDQLSEFLFRTFYIKKRKDIDGESFYFRTFPSAGALNEIEVYVLVNSTTDLSRGIYHYSSKENCLSRLNVDNSIIDEILMLASCTWGRENNYPQCLIILTSIFQKVFWKYERIGYRNILVNAGTIAQTMYLVAEDMGLAACCLGYGCSKLFSKAIEVDPMKETSILEFAIGTRTI